jgi:F-type H+-transporting ATPase subunit epsilon
MTERHENTFRLVIASVSQTLFDGAATSVTLPGSAGDFTILPHHEPLISTLKKGVISVKQSGTSNKEFSIATGVVECSAGKTIVLL